MNNFRKGAFRKLLAILLGPAILLIALPKALASPPLVLEQEAAPASRIWATTSPSDPSAFSSYLPLLSNADAFQFTPSIWAHTALPASPEVVLFRHGFRSDRLLHSAELHIFADTRYEVWIDGQWIGRGPARFSTTLREYDRYELGDLQNDDHLIAVLVQWAPNNRRSESVTPQLVAHIRGSTDGGLVTIAATGASWKCLVSDAWRDDAAPVHAWGLIGPTELLDLRRLPVGWNQPGFPQADWSPAVVVEPASNGYRPRSIPILDNVPASLSLHEAGMLLPGFTVGELVPPVTDPYNLRFSASQPTNLVVKTLAPSAGQPGLIQVDQQGLSWQATGTDHPDLYQAILPLTSGDHQLTFTGIPESGVTFAVSKQDLTFLDFPFQQGANAGRRLLLAEPAQDATAASVTITSDGLNVTFHTLPAYVVLDAGRTVHGRLAAQVSGPAGAMIDIGWDERLSTQTGRPFPYPGSLHPYWDQVDSWILDGAGRSISTLDARAGRFILIAAWGAGPIELQNVRVVEERYPSVQSGSFQSSNPLLNRIWQVGADTARLNLTDAYADPWRERGQWWGDAYIDDHVNRVLSGDPGLLRRGITFMSDAMGDDLSPGDPAPGMAPNNNGLHMLDYAMLWVHSLAEYTEQTQDFSLTDESYPALQRFISHLGTFENPETGLLDLPKQHWSETAYIDGKGFYSRYGQSTALNALYYSTLLRAADLVDRSDPESAGVWRGKAEQVKASVNNLLYLPSQGRYLTHVYGGQPFEPSAHAQAWPLAYGLAPAGEVEPVVAALLELLSQDPANYNVEIYGMFWVLEALGQTGHISEALAIIETYYGYLLDQGATTWWERFDANQYYWASLSHGWGSAPTWFLTTHVLGARRLSPYQWLVKPAFSSLDYASGSLPLKDGSLQVQWERQSCQVKHLVLAAGEPSQGEAVIPYEHPSLVITLDGQDVWRNGIPVRDGVNLQPDGVHIPVSAGNHEIYTHQECIDQLEHTQ